jgi:1,4-dihydroxy-2-naphthoate octaprenyltransferase
VTTAPPRGRALVALYVEGARPRTLGASAVPVAVGVAAAAHAVWWRAILAMVVGLALQIGVNFANDFSDGVRGVDVDRVGPLRLTASGLVAARQVATAAAVSLVVAAVAGIVLALATAPWLIAVGAACIAGAVLYSGGSRPYASLALGEIAVFLFFGPVAVAGTAYVNGGMVPAAAWWAAVSVGLMATLLLVVNNLRDIPGDRVAGKRTLAVRLGPPRTRFLYGAIAATSFAVIVAGVAVGQVPPLALLMLVAAPLAVSPVLAVHRRTGRGLIPALVASARLHLAAGALLTVGLALSH